MHNAIAITTFFLTWFFACTVNAQPLNPRAAADYSAANNGQAVLVMQGGKLVFEEYQNGFRQALTHPLYSGTKTFACALAVAAQDDGIIDLDEPVANVITPWRTNAAIQASQANWKSQITGRQLLSLSSGLSADVPSGTDLATINSYRAAIFTRSATAPGDSAIYGPSTFQAFAAYFELKSGGRLNADFSVTGGKDVLEYLQARVFDPIGMQVGAWTLDTHGRATLSQGANISAREWVKFGQLLLQGGKWEGKTILSESRLRECITFNNPAFSGYGLALWSNRPVGGTYNETIDSLPVNSVSVIDRAAPDVPSDMFMAAGALNQRLYIIPSRDLVVLRFAIGGTWSDNEFLKRLLDVKAGSQAVPAQPFDYQDLWWAGPTENGWGATIAQQGNTLFSVLYIYDSSGKPQWVVMPGGTWNATLSAYTGALYIPSGSPFPAYDATKFNAGTAVGQATLRFRDAGVATLNFTINGVSGTKQITRQVFADGAPRKNYSGMWWGGQSQNGWGVALMQQANNIFGVWFTYDAQGKPIWFVMPGGVFASSTIFEGALYRTSGSAWLGAAYDPALFKATSVGTLRFDFTDANQGVMRHVVDALRGPNTVTRQSFGP